ncbi:MAG: N-acetyltransferase [Ardenticatenaceae bacterium]|nr:N-acetyltransferase [Ardenticatenaceae bacterium]
MNTEEILALYDQQERIHAEHPSYRREVTAETVRAMAHRPERYSFVIYSKLNEDNADAIIQRELDYYRSTGGAGLEWKLYEHDEPADLGERLIAHGFVPEEQEAFLMLDLANLPEVYQRPITADIRRLYTPEEISHVVKVQEQVYDEDFSWLQAQLEENLVAQPDYWSIYAAYVEGKPVCGAWISFPQESSFAGLWGGATLAKYRQKGLYSQVVAVRAQEAIQRGYRFLTVDASDMSRPILMKRGFQLLTYTYPYFWEREANE